MGLCGFFPLSLFRLLRDLFKNLDNIFLISRSPFHSSRFRVACSVALQLWYLPPTCHRKWTESSRLISQFLCVFGVLCPASLLGAIGSPQCVLVHTLISASLGQAEELRTLRLVVWVCLVFGLPPPNERLTQEFCVMKWHLSGWGRLSGWDRQTDRQSNTSLCGSSDNTYH